MKLLRVGIIFGGMSSEKEVSLNSGRNVYDNLDGEKYEGIPIFMIVGEGCGLYRGSLYPRTLPLISQSILKGTQGGYLTNS